MAQIVHSRVKIPSLDPSLDGLGLGFTHQYIGTGTPGSTDWTALIDAIVAFFNTTASGATEALYNYLNQTLDVGTNHSNVTLYDVTAALNGGPAGSPIATANFTLTGTNGAGKMPEGICAVAGMQAAYGTDVEFGASAAIPTPPDIVADFGAAATHVGRPRPRARDRGRIYLGPLGTGPFNQDSVTHRTLFSATFMADVCHALFALADVSESGTPTWAMRVWSRRNASVKLIDHFRISDRPGYQRRRVDQSNAPIVVLAGPAV